MDWILDSKASTKFPVSTRSNAEEVFPDPISPLNATTGFLENFERGYRETYVNIGAWDHDMYRDEVRWALLSCLGGYLYINVSYLRVSAVRTPGLTTDMIDQAFGVPSDAWPYEREKQDWHEDAAASQRVGEWVVKSVFGRDDLADLDEERQIVLALRAQRPDLTTLTDEELAQRLVSFNPVLARLFATHTEVALKASFAIGGLAALCAELGVPTLASDLTVGVGDIDSVGPSRALWTLGRAINDSEALTRIFDEGVPAPGDLLEAGADGEALKQSFDQFIADWGFRGPGEWEIKAPTWGTKPALAMGQLARIRHAGTDASPKARGEAMLAKSQQARETLFATIDESSSDHTQHEAEQAIAVAQLWTRGRERTRMSAAMLLHELRLVGYELGRRGVEAGVLENPGQFFMLLAEEVPDYVKDPGSFSETVRERNATYDSLYDFIPPSIVVGDVAPRSEWQRRSDRKAPSLEVGESVVGGCGCPGSVTGRARIIDNPEDIDDFEPGDILIANVTDPSWTPLFLVAAAVVTEAGGAMSHAPIVCRELGVPCVIAAREATIRIPDGAVVRVDGQSGSVTLLSPAGEADPTDAPARTPFAVL